MTRNLHEALMNLAKLSDALDGEPANDKVTRRAAERDFLIGARIVANAFKAYQESYGDDDA